MSGSREEELDEDGFQTMPNRKPRKSNDRKKTVPRQQRRSANNHTGKRQPNKGRRGKKGFTSGPSLSAKGWSKPSDGWNDGGKAFEEETQEETVPVTTNEEDPIDTTSEEMASSVIRTEVSKASTADEKIDAALASTAAETTMASLMAKMGFAARRQQQQIQSCDKLEKGNKKSEAPSFTSFAKGQQMEDLLGDLGERDPNWKEKQFPFFSDEGNVELNPCINSNNVEKEQSQAPSFLAFCKGQSASELLADFGQADPHWKEKVIVEEDSKITSEQQQETKQSRQKTQKQAPSLSKLAPHGKAPIHVSIESFGIAHGAPSRGARDRSGSPHTQPLEWLDVGDSITNAVPEHLEFHDGLRSGVIKRLLKTVPLATEGKNGWNDYDDDDDDESSIDLQNFRDFSSYCREHLAGNKIFPSLLEAIHEGGHGYVNPLTMRFSIGSHLGRHRSVVATEWVAQHLRYLLRNHNQRILQNNEQTKPYNPKDNRPITCSVSVGTHHRDVSKRIPQKHYKEDDADYVDKKDRF